MPLALGFDYTARLPTEIAVDSAGRLLSSDSPTYTWGQARGNPASTAGTIADIYAYRTEIELLQPNLAKYLDGANAAFNNSNLWLHIPLMVSGWRNWTVILENNLPISIDAQVYYAPALPASRLSGNTTTIAYYATVTAGNRFITHATDYYGARWLGAPGYLSLAIIPASDPSSGDLMLTVQRST